MTRLNLTFPDDVADELKRRAADAGLSVSKYVRELLDGESESEWPEGFAGGWSGDRLERPEQGAFENRTDADSQNCCVRSSIRLSSRR